MQRTTNRLPKLRFSENDVAKDSPPQAPMVKLPSPPSSNLSSLEVPQTGLVETVIRRIKNLRTSNVGSSDLVNDSKPTLNLPSPRPQSSKSVVLGRVQNRVRTSTPSSVGFAELASKPSSSKSNPRSSKSQIAIAQMFRKAVSQNSEELLVKPNKPASFVLSSTSPAKRWWDLFIIVTTTAYGFFLTFNWAFMEKPLLIVDLLVRFIYFTDFVLSLRTSVYSETGEKVESPRMIFWSRARTAGFYIDLMAALPITELHHFWDEDHWQCLQFICLIKFINLNWTTVSSKLGMGLTKRLWLFSALLLYLHCGACFHYKVSARLELWEPNSRTSSGGKFYMAPISTRYLECFYTSALTLVGNETNPEGNLQLIVASLMLISGALIQAAFFGEVAASTSIEKRKQIAYQEELDEMNSTMRSMKLPQEMRDDVQDYMAKTESNLHSQQQLDTFMKKVSPSLRSRVTNFIFKNSISRISVLRDSLDSIEHLISDIQIQMSQPEVKILQQGKDNNKLFLIENGECEVWVRDYNNQDTRVRILGPGSYFGEVSTIWGTPCTATIKTSNYCTLAVISKEALFEMGQCAPEIVRKLKDRTLLYDDLCKQFKLNQLRKIEFLTEGQDSDALLNELANSMADQYVNNGKYISQQGEVAESIWFIIDGLVELYAPGEDGKLEYFDSLKAGDVIAPYSFLFKEKMHFSAMVVSSQVRLLQLDGEAFLNLFGSEAGDSLQKAIQGPEQFIRQNGYPSCDYIRGVRMADSLQSKIRRSSLKAKLFLTPKSNPNLSQFARIKNVESEDSPSATSSRLSPGLPKQSPLFKLSRSPEENLSVPTDTFQNQRRKSVISEMFPRRRSGVGPVQLVPPPKKVPSGLIDKAMNDLQGMLEVHLSSSRSPAQKKLKSSMVSWRSNIKELASPSSAIPHPLRRKTDQESLRSKPMKADNFVHSSLDSDTSQSEVSPISHLQLRSPKRRKRTSLTLMAGAKEPSTAKISPDRQDQGQDFSLTLLKLSHSHDLKQVSPEDPSPILFRQAKPQPIRRIKALDSQMSILEENLAEEMNSESLQISSVSSRCEGGLPAINFTPSINNL